MLPDADSYFGRQAVVHAALLPLYSAMLHIDMPAIDALLILLR